jgi:hypothetical protein
MSIQGLHLSGKVLSMKASPKGFIISVLAVDKVAKFFTKDPGPYPIGKEISVKVTGPQDGFLGFVEA